MKHRRRGATAKTPASDMRGTLLRIRGFFRECGSTMPTNGKLAKGARSANGMIVFVGRGHRSSRRRATYISRPTGSHSSLRIRHPVRPCIDVTSRACSGRVMGRKAQTDIAIVWRAELAAFDLPLGMLQAEKFNQPIFGCNNLSGDIAPMPPVRHL